MGVKLYGKNRRRGVAAIGDDGKIPAEFMPGAGVANPFPDQVMDNADITHPVKVGFEVDNTRTVSDIVLTVYTDYFRAYAQGAASGGVAATSTESDAAHSHSLNAVVSGAGSNHSHGYTYYHSHTVNSHSHSNEHAHGIPNVWTQTDLQLSDPYRHSHEYTYHGGGTTNTIINTSSASPATDVKGGTTEYTNTESQHSHGFTGSTTSSDAAHSHQLNLPAHEHDVTYGIYEYEEDDVNYYAPVKLYINDPGVTTPNTAFGTKGDENNRVDSETSLITLYVSGDPAIDVIGDGENTFYILPEATGHNTKGLIRITATVTVSYTDGASGITVSSCYDSTRWNGKTMPIDLAGYLQNDGAGNLSWSGSATVDNATHWNNHDYPTDAAGYLQNDGAGNLSFSGSAIVDNATHWSAHDYPASSNGLLHDDGAGNLSWLAESTFATAGHNHNSDYLGITAQAADSHLLDGNHADAFALSGHNHDSAYLGLTAKAADSELLDGLDSLEFLRHDGIAVNSTKWNGKDMPGNANAYLLNDGAGNLSWAKSLKVDSASAADNSTQWNGKAMPGNANAYLLNDGAGNLSWAKSLKVDSATAADSATNSTQWNSKAMPANLAGSLTNDGSGNLSWVPGSAGLTYNSGTASFNQSVGAGATVNWDIALGASFPYIFASIISGGGARAFFDVHSNWASCWGNTIGYKHSVVDTYIFPTTGANGDNIFGGAIYCYLVRATATIVGGTTLRIAVNNTGANAATCVATVRWEGYR